MLQNAMGMDEMCMMNEVCIMNQIGMMTESEPRDGRQRLKTSSRETVNVVWKPFPEEQQVYGPIRLLSSTSFLEGNFPSTH